MTPGQHASFLGKAFDPFFIGQDPNRSDFRLPELSLPSSLSLDRLDDRRGLQQMIDQQTDLATWSETARGIDAFYSRAVTMLSSPKVKRAFDLSQEPGKLRDAYGRTTYGQSCLLARRLVEAGVRFVSVYFSESIGGKGNGGWDTHGDNFNQLKKRLLPVTDMAVPTLIEDLQARGLLEETLVVWMGEFGRTPKVENTKQFGPDGRGHWPNCYTVLFAGGGITPGRSTARATASAPIRRPTRSVPTTSPRPCSGPGHRPGHRGHRHPGPAPRHRGGQADYADLWLGRYPQPASARGSYLNALRTNAG